MRTFEELKAIFDILVSCNEPIDMGSEKKLLVRYKWIAAIASKLYPEESKGSFNARVSKEGKFLHEGSYVEDDMDYSEFIYETSMCHGDVDSYVLSYMKKSPFWDSYIVHLGCDCYADEKEKPFLSFLKKRFGDFFEEELYEEMEAHPLEPLYNMFEYDDNGAVDDVCIIRSALYPYVDKLKKAAEKQHAEYISYLDRAYKIIGDWMIGDDYHFVTDKYGYFACCDGSSYAYCWGSTGGALELNIAIVICAELIERIMFDMNEIYHFLPDMFVGLFGLFGKGSFVYGK